jgi:hypothetical protein
MKSSEGVSRLVRDGLDLPGRVERNPYGMVAGALAAGYIMGGGIFTRLTERIAGTVLRAGVMAIWPRIEHEILSRGRAEEERTVGEKGE